MPSRFFDFKNFMVKILSLLNQKLMMVSKLTRLVAVTYKKIQPHLLLGSSSSARHPHNSDNKLQIKSLISTKIEGFLNPNYFNWIH